MFMSKSNSLLAAMSSMVVVAAAAVAVAGPVGAEQVDSARWYPISADVLCTGPLSGASEPPVLLVPGTGANPDEDFGWNLETTLPQAGFTACAVTIPKRGWGDLQDNADVVAAAIRTLSSAAGQKIAVVGHSQGAMLPTFALRVYPDLAESVDDFVGFAGSYTAGTTVADLPCALPCAAGVTQMRPGSELMKAMSARPLPAGPSYTAFSTDNDEAARPQPLSSRLDAPGVRNIRVQEYCPLLDAPHLTLPGTLVLMDLTIDALNHPGPAQPTRLTALRCGLDTDNVVAGALGTLGLGFGSTVDYPSVLVTEEPRLRCPYRLTGCA
ncbi:alpha/beta fold hydrolase [Nocardia gamkensis]|uniref:lipase family alpha/beta hydrolase n=1 Tax=Nocardia gamkensis TaxID=352869 RepID=UPI0033E1822A